MKKLLTSTLAVLLAFFATEKLFAQSVVNFPMSAWTTGVVYMHDGTPLQFYGFSKGLSAPTLPGPVIELEEGDTLVATIRNRSREHHTIHWHGLDVDQANDGVPHTSSSIDHDSTFVYRFPATHAGMYFYHCHVLSVWHVQLGMYGTVIVRPKNAPNTVWTGGPTFDREAYWLSSEIDPYWFDNVPVQHMGDSAFESVAVPAYTPDYFLVNGMGGPQLDTARSVRILGNTGEEVHLNIGNMGYADNRVVFPAALNARIVASDGRPLPFVLQQDSLTISPGERYSILLNLQGNTTDSISFAWHDMFTGTLMRQDFIPVIHGVGIGTEESASSRDDHFVLFPQPATDQLFLQSDTPFRPGSSYQILNIHGQELANGKLLSGSGVQAIQLRDLPGGMYVLRMQSAGAPARARRFVVER